MPTPLEDAQSMVSAYTAAELSILQGKEVKFGDRMMRHEDLSFVREGRKEWEARVRQLQQTGARVPTFGGLSYSVADFGNR